jgi:hypothetical protein
MGGPLDGSHSRTAMLPFLKSFARVLAPCLETDDRKHLPIFRNSILRHLLMQPILLSTLAASALAGFLSGRMLVGLATAIMLFAIGGRRLVEGTIFAAVHGTVAIAERALAHANATGGVDLVIGQSWGGAVAVLMLHQGLYRGPMLLMGPAVVPLLGRSRRLRPAQRLPDAAAYPRRLIAVVSGEEDTAVDPVAVEEWCASEEVPFHKLLGSGHNLCMGAHAERETRAILQHVRALLRHDAATKPAPAAPTRRWREGIDRWLTTEQVTTSTARASADQGGAGH